MAYHTADEVKVELKNITVSDTTGIIRTAQLAAAIVQTDAYIDSRLANKYITPITGTNALIVVKYIAIGLTAGRMNDILRKGPEALAAEDSDRISGLIATARAQLKELEEGRGILSDAPRVGALSSNVGFYKEGSGPVIQKDVVQW